MLLPEQYIRIQRTAHSFMLGMQVVVLAGALYVLYVGGGASLSALHGLLMWAAPITTLLAVGMSVAVFSLLTRRIKPDMRLLQKLPRMQTATAVRLGMLNGAALFNLMLYYLVGHPLYAGLYALVAFVFIQARPNLSTWLKQLKLTPEQEKELRRSR